MILSRLRCLAGVLLALALASPAVGQTPTPQQESPTPNPGMDETRREEPNIRIPLQLAGVVDPKTYRVGPGDLLQAQMWGRVQRSWTMEVGPEGYIMLPGAGVMSVADRTLAEVRTEILRRLATEYRAVSMDVRLTRPRTFKVYLAGQVKTPGPVAAGGQTRVGDVLNEAVLMENASRRRIELQHRDGSVEIADLDLFTRTGDQSLNPWLRDGDVINVRVATDFIWAQGALARGGRFELGPKDSLLTLFRLAGDPMPAADITRALLLRWKDPFTPESLWVRLDEVYSRRINPDLREGDRVYVYYLPQYHLQHEATVAGEVARPGSYPITEGRHHLSDLIRSAGGFLPTADLSAIRVHRYNPRAGERDPEMERLLRLSRDQLTASEYDALRTKLSSMREDYSVDWNRLQKSPRDLDLLVRAGDIVRVERLVNSIRIDGEVKRPGILTYRQGQGIRDYVDQAGGFTNRAWTGRIRVTRAVTGQVLPARDVRSLDPGDFVWVPERPDRTAWDAGRDLLTSLAQIATVIIAIRSIK